MKYVNNNNSSLCAPWVIFYRKIEALFKDDPDIKIEYDNDNVEVILTVEGFNTNKAEAIAKLLPKQIPFGKVTLTITVVSSNVEEASYSDLVKAAFKGNPHFDRVYKKNTKTLAPSYEFGIFKNESVQYYIDDLTEYKGMCTELYADLAKEVFDNPTGFYFTTEA